MRQLSPGTKSILSYLLVASQVLKSYEQGYEHWQSCMCLLIDGRARALHALVPAVSSQLLYEQCWDQPGIPYKTGPENDARSVSWLVACTGAFAEFNLLQQNHNKQHRMM